MARKYDVGIRLFNEHGCNMNYAQRGEYFANWIQIGEESRCVLAFNTHDSCSKTLYQPGGTGIYVSGEMTQRSGTRDTVEAALPRWCPMTFSQPT